MGILGQVVVKEFPNEEPIRMLAQYYVDLDDEVRSGALLNVVALALVVLAIVVQWRYNHGAAWSGRKHDFIRSIFFGLLITPWAVFTFLSVVVEQLEESRQRLSRLVQKLEEMPAQFEPQRSVKRLIFPS
ncbi:hypothetical protein ACLK1T_15880 [Escherichia coli]